MYSSENPRKTERRAFLEASFGAVDEARDRGSSTGCWSALLVAIAIVLTLWSGDFVSENAARAWQAIEHDAHLLAQEIDIGPALATAGEGPYQGR
jgi:hypothetical protein